MNMAIILNPGFEPSENESFSTYLVWFNFETLEEAQRCGHLAGSVISAWPNQWQPTSCDIV